jgi:hypothetical protein
MAGTIATLLSTAKAISKVDADNRAGQRQAYDELIQLQNQGDPTLASPYVDASAVSTVAANGGTTGNFTLTLNFPEYGVTATTANIVYNAAEAAIQSAIDTAMSGKVVVATYSAGDVDAGACVNMASASCNITANGTTVNKAHMIVTTANVDMDVAAPGVTVVTVGTANRPAEAMFAYYGCLTPNTIPAGHGVTPSDGDYVDGDNPLSLSPGLKALLVTEMEVSENGVLGQWFRTQIGCVR